MPESGAWSGIREITLLDEDDATMAASEHMKSLVKKKDDIESELKELSDVLESVSCVVDFSFGRQAARVYVCLFCLCWTDLPDLRLRSEGTTSVQCLNVENAGLLTGWWRSSGWFEQFAMTVFAVSSSGCSYFSVQIYCLIFSNFTLIFVLVAFTQVTDLVTLSLYDTVDQCPDHRGTDWLFSEDAYMWLWSRFANCQIYCCSQLGSSSNQTDAIFVAILDSTYTFYLCQAY